MRKPNQPKLPVFVRTWMTIVSTSATAVTATLWEVYMTLARGEEAGTPRE